MDNALVAPKAAPTPHRPRRELVYRPFSTREWRVCDSRFDSNDIRGLLGFVQRRGDLFEVVRVGNPHVRSWYSSLEETRAQFMRPHVFLEHLPWHIPEIDPDAPLDEEEAPETVRAIGRRDEGSLLAS